MFYFINEPMFKYIKLNDWFNNWENVVLPVPGVPVIKMFGVLWGVYKGYYYIRCWILLYFIYYINNKHFIRLYNYKLLNII